MPRTNFGAAMERARAREAALSTLPADVRAGVMTLSEEGQEAYLASIGKAAEMAASGDTFTPDLSKNAAKVTKAKTKAKPGRPAAANAGQRTQEKMEPSLHRPVDLERLEAIMEHPEDDPEVSVVYGSSTDEPAAPGPTAAQLQAERDAALEDARRAELEAAVAKLGDAGGWDVVSPVFSGQKRIDPSPDAGPLAVAKIVEYQYRVTGTDQEYVLERREADGKGGWTGWQEASRGYTVSALAFHFGFYNIVAPGLSEATKGLPVYRPGRQAYLEQFRTKGSGEGVPRTPEERMARDKLIQEDLERQRASSRVRQAGRPGPGYSWFKV